jgi:predicted amidohydrolase YtcJ
LVNSSRSTNLQPKARPLRLRAITLDESAAESEAIAVTGSRIVASGNRDDILVLAGDNTETITIPGIAVPGWVDAHVHVSGLGSLLEKLNVQAIDKQRIDAARRVDYRPWLGPGVFRRAGATDCS